jgi:hypothetical protein
MFELTPATAIMTYLGLSMSVILGFWAYSHYTTRHKKVSLVDQQLYSCEFCHFAHLDDIQKEVTKCPQCLCYTKHLGSSAP